MADNFTAPAAGTTFAAKDIGGVQHPKTIIVEFDGADAALGSKLNLLHADLLATPGRIPITLVDRSGTIATANTQQSLAPPNASRRGLSIQNNSTGDLRVNAKGTASPTAGILLPGGQNALYEFPLSGTPASAVSIWGATAGQAFEASEW